jgi:hypothetical protein
MTAVSLAAICCVILPPLANWARIEWRSVGPNSHLDYSDLFRLLLAAADLPSIAVLLLCLSLPLTAIAIIRRFNERR